MDFRLFNPSQCKKALKLATATGQSEPQQYSAHHKFSLNSDEADANLIRTARPLEYYRKFIENDVRPDERTLEQFRPTVLNIGCIGTAEGSAHVKLGNTAVICGIKAEIATPKAEEPKKGFIVPNVELGPLCSSRFKPGPPGEQAQQLSQFMFEVLTHSCCIDLEDLCIVPDKHVWVLYCDLVCLDYDGNLSDACVLALLAAFRSLSLPTVTLNEDTECLETDEEKQVNLTIRCNPVSTSFAVFDETILIVDPTIEEEGLSTGEVTIVTADNDLCIIKKPGGSPLTQSQLSDCIDLAFTRSKDVLRLMEDTIHSIDR